MKSVIDIVDLSVEEINSLIHTACDMIDNPKKYSDCCRGKKIATLFYEAFAHHGWKSRIPFL